MDSFSSMSVDKFIIDLELVEMVKQALGEIEIESDADLSFDTIMQAKDSGQFLTTMETVTRCRTHSWNPRVGVRGALTADDYQTKLFKNIDETLFATLAEYQRPYWPPEIIAEMETHLLQCGLDEQTLRRINPSSAMPSLPPRITGTAA
jgi:trimethylamine--corrinoid protein Co-methyltransferase